MVKAEYISGLQKGILFDILTAGGTAAECRATPATRDELMAAGLSEDDVDYYFELIKHLYAVGFIYQNNLMKDAEPFACETWTRLCTFCFDCHLLPEPICRDLLPGIYFQNALNLTQPLKIQRFPECPYAIYVPDVDVFRAYIERDMAGLTWKWQLAEYCNVYLIDNDNDDGIIHEYVWDEEQNMLVRLTPSRIREILKRIYADIRHIDQEIVDHNHNVPPYVARNDDEWNEMLRLGDEWIRERVRLEWRFQFLASCESWFNVPMPNFQKHKQGENTDE